MTGSILLGPTDVGSYVGVRGDRIDCLEMGPPPGEWELELDCSGAWVWPGAVNAHTHVYSGLAPLGMPALAPKPKNFVEILERLWWKLDAALDEATLRASARYYVAQSLLYGATTLIDHHESPNLIEGSLDILADACAELGVRGVLCYGATERNDGVDEARRGLAECRRFIEENERPLVRGLVALHASFTVSDPTVAAAAELCADLHVPMHVHMAEDGADVDDAVERGYAGPLERLHDLHALPRGSVLAHGVHLSEAQVRAARDHGCWFVQNPRSNDGNNVGYARNLSASHRVALGTDGYPADLRDEREALFRLGVEYGDREDILEERCRAGQRLAGEIFEAPFGRAAVNSVADLVVREKDGGVRHVLVGGALVVRDGLLVHADLDEIQRVAEEQAQRLWRRMADL